MNLHTMDVICEEEGHSLAVYEDSLGHLTVGIGHKILPEDDLKMGDTIDDERELALFLADVKIADKGAESLIGTHQIDKVHHVLTCMVFQIGVAGVQRFEKMLRALHLRDYHIAAHEMLDSKWAKEQTPERAKRLANEMWTGAP
jgi:lysozyme